VLAVVVSTAAMTLLADLELGAALFEVTSALATVGLSVGVTGSLPPSAQVLLVVLMYVGRLGPLAVASVLLAREARVRYRLPEERVLLG
jgi:trk system potassium uptake protein TrkH